LPYWLGLRRLEATLLRIVFIATGCGDKTDEQ
jgi:hypothetical protein